MGNETFASGELTTAFIPQEFPDGYTGHALSPSERSDLLACAAALTHCDTRRAFDGADAFAPSTLSLRVAADGEQVQPPRADPRVTTYPPPRRASRCL